MTMSLLKLTAPKRLTPEVTIAAIAAFELVVVVALGWFVSASNLIS
jgi:hypothetical protein